MIDTATIERYLRDVNPIRDVDDLDRDEFARFVAAAETKRVVTMQETARDQIAPAPAATPSSQRRRRAWGFAIAFVVVLVAVGIAALASRDDTPPVVDEPAPPTTVAETPGEPIDVESLNWTRIPLDAAVFNAPVDRRYPLEVSDIVAGGPGLVAVGGAGPSGTEHATIWTSSDMYTWSRVPYDADTFGWGLEIKAVTVGGPGLVAVGKRDVWTSPDGYNWSRATLDEVQRRTGDLGGVVAGGPGLVAFGDSGVASAVWTSPDGYTWTRVPHNVAVFGRSSINSVVRGGPGLVAVGVKKHVRGSGSELPIVWTSPDGFTWSRVPHDPTVFNEGSAMVDVAAGGPGLVAVGFHRIDESLVAAVWTSPDGFSWTRVPHDEVAFGGPYETMNSVAAVGDGFVAVGSWFWGNVWISPDGLSWARISAGPDHGPPGSRDDPIFGEGSMFKVIAGGPGVVALGGVPGAPAMWVATPTDTNQPAPPADTKEGGTP